MSANSTSRTVIASVVVAAVTVLGAWAAGAALRHDPAAKAAFPALAQPVPVVHAVAKGDTSPSFDGDASLGTIAEHSQLGWVQPVADQRSDLASLAGSTTTASPTAAPTTSTSSSTVGSDSASTTESTRGSGDGTDDGTAAEHFDDPCAPADGSSPTGSGSGGTDCPEGRHSVILPLTAVDPLQMVVRANPGPQSAVVNPAVVACDEQEAAPRAMVDVSTNNPLVSGTLTWWDQATPTDRHEIAVNDSASIRDDFDAHRAADDWIYDTRHLFHHCLRLDGLAVAHTYGVAVTATGSDGATAIATTTFTPVDHRDHPPTTVGPLNGNLQVVGWNRPGTRLAAVAYQLAPGDDPTAACGWLRAAGIGDSTAHSPVEPEEGAIRTRTVAADELAADTYRYDPTWNQVTSLRFDRLGEGTRYSLCVTRISTGASVFDQNDMSDAEVFTVGVPNRMRAKLVVTQIAAQNVRQVDVVTTPAGLPSQQCGLTANVDGAATVLDPPVTLCDLATQQGSLSRYDRGVDLHLAVGTGGPSVRSTVRLDVGLPSCAGPCAARAPEWFSVPLPAVAVGTGMCSGPCDPPSTLRSLGTMLVEVTFDDGATDGGVGWDISDAHPVTTSGGLSGDAPRYDWNQEVVVQPLVAAAPFGAANFRMAGATVPIVTDRPTTASVELLDANTNGAPCFVTTDAPASAATATDASLATNHRASFTDLCPGSSYFTQITVVAENGTSTSFRGQFFQVPGVQAHIVASITWSGLPFSDRAFSWDATVGDPFTITDGHRSGSGTFSLFAPSWHNDLACDSNLHGASIDNTMSLPLSVTMEATISAADLVDPATAACRWGSSSSRHYRSVDLRATVSLIDLARADAARVVTISTPPDADFQATVTFSFSGFDTAP